MDSWRHGWVTCRLELYCGKPVANCKWSGETEAQLNCTAAGMISTHLFEESEVGWMWRQLLLLGAGISVSGVSNQTHGSVVVLLLCKLCMLHSAASAAGW